MILFLKILAAAVLLMVLWALWDFYASWKVARIARSRLVYQIARARMIAEMERRPWAEDEGGE